VRKLSLILSAIAILLACKSETAAKNPASTAKAASGGNPHVVLETSHGEIEIELYPDKAPKGVANFLKYVESGRYDGTIFHRVLPGFVVQGGGFDANLERRPTFAPLENEADNGLHNERGTVAWARTPDPHSATNQFYVNVADNAKLDHRDKTPQGWGYAVFGRVVRGMEVAEKLSRLPTGPRGMHPNVPTEPAGINRARVKK
jgi:peptidyl-prolyl cis-trans isomerase B (cyclophilin B)